MTISPFAPLLIMLAWAAPDDEPFRSLVRTTEPLSAEQEQKSFQVPPGFEVQLFAAEPEIQKPMNMAIDAAGRMWVSGSVEYPYAAAEGQGHDEIKVLTDTDGDGRADRFTTFVDGLNIPIGLYPYRDGVVAYSIPNIWFFRDTDNDGKADRREILYGPLGTPRDTHGMQNAFRRGFDGWLYINHGFANETTLTGRDGSRITLQSGNTYRVRLDGSRVEQFTWGQVNPFGSTFLPNGDLITADCHSRPLTLLQRGAYYQSFGKPHDGLGFAPDLMEHSHGSTAIAGTAYYTGHPFPPEYQGHLFTGNVMTSRVNHDDLRYTGATPQANEQSDFVKTDDPWFRPVDLQVGPDGALYIADFYNRIIGHYEVALDHPGRDKMRGRIWRVVYRGTGSSNPTKAPDLSRADTAQLLAELANPSLTRRMLATDQLSDRVGEAAVNDLIKSGIRNANEFVRVHSLWVLHRLGQLTETNIRELSNDSSELVRIHAMRALAETPQWKINVAALAEKETSPHVRRAAADAAAQQVPPAATQWLALLAKTQPDDTLLRHAMRLAIRNQLRSPDAWSSIQRAALSDSQQKELATIAVAVPTAEAAVYLLAHLRENLEASQQVESQLNHLCTHLPAEKLPEIVAIARKHSKSNVDLQLRLLMLLAPRVRQRNGRDMADIQQWGEELASSLLRRDPEAVTKWRTESGEQGWGLEVRNCEDGQTGVMFLSSLPGGEQTTSVLKSTTFSIPAKFSFYVCGHLGFPDKPPVEKNMVRLRLADTGQIIQQVFPPRNDMARRVEWDLSAHANQRGYLEVVDGLNLSAYAWLAVARFEPAVVTLPKVSPAKLSEYRIAACTIVSSLHVDSLRAEISQWVSDNGQSWPVRAAAAQAELSFSPRPVLGSLAVVIAESSVDARIRDAICRQIAHEKAEAPVQLQVDVMRAVPARMQRQIADVLTSSPSGSEALVTLVELGHAAPRLLQDVTISQKLAAAHVLGLDERIANLTASLPPLNAEIQKLVEQRRRTFADAVGDVIRGQELFRKNCAACHQIGGQGMLIGPQLDGIGNRGVERVIEDVLDPNRNVDTAFHVTVYAFSNGLVLPGMLRRDEGANLIVANQEGKEITIAKSDIDEQTKSNTSLMPANFGEVLTLSEFRDLVAYLLTLRPEK